MIMDGIGNAHVKAEHVFNPKLMKAASKTFPILSSAFNIVELSDIALTVYNEGKISTNTKVKIAQKSGGTIGGFVGTTICGAIGSSVGPLGTVAGASICAPLGSWIGEALSEDVANGVLKDEK